MKGLRRLSGGLSLCLAKIAFILNLLINFLNRLRHFTLFGHFHHIFALDKLLYNHLSGWVSFQSFQWSLIEFKYTFLADQSLLSFRLSLCLTYFTLILNHLILLFSRLFAFLCNFYNIITLTQLFDQDLSPKAFLFTLYRYLIHLENRLLLNKRLNSPCLSSSLSVHQIMLNWFINPLNLNPFLINTHHLICLFKAISWNRLSLNSWWLNLGLHLLTF